MLPWLALTYTAARLGFEAQNAAFRLFRLSGGVPKTAAADELALDAIVPPADTPAQSGRAENAARRKEDSQKIGARS